MTCDVSQGDSKTDQGPCRSRIESPLILLAGGRSRRMGSPKGLLAVPGSGGRTWSEAQIEAFAEVGGRRAVLVLGHGSQEYFERLPQLTTSPSMCHGVELFCVQSHDPERGPFASLQAGIGCFVGRDVFVSPIDVPLATRAVFESMKKGLDEGAHVVKPTYRGRGGHPVLLSSVWARSLLSVDPFHPDGRLDRQIQMLEPSKVVHTPVRDERILKNLNCPAAWEQWHNKEASRPDHLP